MSDGPVLVIEDDTERARTWQELLEFADSESLIDSYLDAAQLQLPLPVSTPCLVDVLHRTRRRRSEGRGSS